MKSFFLALVLATVGFFSVTSTQAQTHNHTITIQNYSITSIYEVYINPSSYSTWGYDRLGSEGTIPNGMQRSISLTGHIYYDFKSVESDSDTCILKNILLDQNIIIRVTNNNCYVIRPSSPNYDGE